MKLTADSHTHRIVTERDGDQRRWQPSSASTTSTFSRLSGLAHRLPVRVTMDGLLSGRLPGVDASQAGLCTSRGDIRGSMHGSTQLHTEMMPDHQNASDPPSYVSGGHHPIPR